MNIRGIDVEKAIDIMRDQYSAMRETWDYWCASDDDEVMESPEKPDFPRWLNAYELSRNLGGHEEGGWYYDSGEPVFAVRIVNADEMEEALRLLYSIWAESVEGDRSYTSVLGGCDIRIRIEPEIAKEWPENAPRYE
jgi:hypothetical protein